MTEPAWLEGAFQPTRRGKLGGGKAAPDEWYPWLADLFPKHVRHPFADRHAEFWEYVWSIEPDTHPRPFVGVWARGGGKSTSTELATTALGVRGKRRYALYVRGTQEQADKSVANIAALLVSDGIAAHYPEHAQRSVDKFGSSRGWRRNRVMTAGGFTVDAIGLDTAARGVKVEDQRPDLIILDDIDDKHDSPVTTAKKIATITASLLPAGSDNCVVIAIQNLIIPDGFFTRMVDGRADYMADRIVSGPHPAVIGLKTEWQLDPETNTRRAVIIEGEPTWEGQDLETCQRQINTWGLQSFKKESQHEVTNRADGLALRFDARRHLADLTDEECRELVAMGRVFGGIDFGAWRFVFTLWAVDRVGVPYAIAEYFSQRSDSLSIRARRIHEICSYYGAPPSAGLPFIVWGDAANPTDITEINQHWVKGWVDGAGKHVTSPLRCRAVAMENKLRKTSVERINDQLDKNALRFRRTLGLGTEWQLGAGVSSEGAAMHDESRLLWEINHWAYLAPKEGEIQEQDPSDDTADGGDAIASMRYALMSWWSAAPAAPLPPPPNNEDRSPGVDWRGGTRRRHEEGRTAVDVAALRDARLSPKEQPRHPKLTRPVTLPRYRGSR